MLTARLSDARHRQVVTTLLQTLRASISDSQSPSLQVPDDAPTHIDGMLAIAAGREGTCYSPALVIYRADAVDGKPHTFGGTR